MKDQVDYQSVFESRESISMPNLSSFEQGVPVVDYHMTKVLNLSLIVSYLHEYLTQNILILDMKIDFPKQK